jgi:acetyl-CoA synthetase
MFEGVPTWPSASRIWEIVDKHFVTHLYTAPTLVRTLMSAGDDYVQRTSRKSLRVLGSVGEPINPEAWRWYFNVAGEGRCPIADTWWQTETGMIMIAPVIAEGSTFRPGCAATPFFGAQPAILDRRGKELEGECEGLLAMKAPWPSMLRGVWNNPQRYLDTYFPFSGFYLTGDGAKRDSDGFIWITGRADDVMVVSGHNIGTAEVESAAILHPLVSEAAVVGVEHPIKGQSLFLFVTPRDGAVFKDANLKAEVRKLVREKVGSFAAPDMVHIVPVGLPKTRSGKIMRRILRKVAVHGKELDVKDLGDTSTLADATVVDALIASF